MATLVVVPRGGAGNLGRALTLLQTVLCMQLPLTRLFSLCNGKTPRFCPGTTPPASPARIRVKEVHQRLSMARKCGTMMEKKSISWSRWAATSAAVLAHTQRANLPVGQKHLLASRQTATTTATILKVAMATLVIAGKVVMVQGRPSRHLLRKRWRKYCTNW